jgi:hypothetical protein
VIARITSDEVILFYGWEINSPPTIPVIPHPTLSSKERENIPYPPSKWGEKRKGSREGFPRAVGDK